MVSARASNAAAERKKTKALRDEAEAVGFSTFLEDQLQSPIESRAAARPSTGLDWSRPGVSFGSRKERSPVGSERWSLRRASTHIEILAVVENVERTGRNEPYIVP